MSNTSLLSRKMLKIKNNPDSYYAFLITCKHRHNLILIYRFKNTEWNFTSKPQELADHDSLCKGMHNNFSWICIWNGLSIIHKSLICSNAYLKGIQIYETSRIIGMCKLVNSNISQPHTGHAAHACLLPQIYLYLLMPYTSKNKFNAKLKTGNTTCTLIRSTVNMYLYTFGKICSTNSRLPWRQVEIFSGHLGNQITCIRTQINYLVFLMVMNSKHKVMCITTTSMGSVLCKAK